MVKQQIDWIIETLVVLSAQINDAESVLGAHVRVSHG